MANIICSCGNRYEDTFKFCPECAAPNPKMQNRKPKLQEVSIEDTPAEQPSVRKKFKKLGESSLSDASTPTIPVQKTKPVPEPEYEEDDEDIEDEYEYEEDIEDEDEDDSSEEDYEDEDYEDYEDEDEDEDEDDEEPIPVSRVKKSTLAAPTVKTTKQAASSQKAKPQAKKISSTKSSLGKKNKAYDPNYDGYYDDRLPAILDEVTKTSHADVILKISLAIVCIAALITYCIFYVQV